MASASAPARVSFHACCTALCLIALLGGCAFFAPAPPLPRHAALEPKSSDEEFTTLIEGADIIYFPQESATFSRRSDLAPRLLEALPRSGNPLAIGWEADPAGEFGRAVATEAEKLPAEILALRRPSEWVPDENSNVVMQPEDYERFARRPEFRGSTEPKIRSAYEGELMTQQFAAGKIAAYSREHRNCKILVFLRRTHLGETHGVPYLVARKTKARQLVLNPRPLPTSGPTLLTRLGLGRGWRLAANGFQIVDRPPFAGSHHR